MSLYLVETHQPLLNFFKYFSLNALVEPEEESYEHYEIQTKYFLSLSFIRMNQKLRVRKNVLEPLALQYTFTHTHKHKKSYEPGRSVCLLPPKRKYTNDDLFYNACNLWHNKLGLLAYFLCKAFFYWYTSSSISMSVAASGDARFCKINYVVIRRVWWHSLILNYL